MIEAILSLAILLLSARPLEELMQRLKLSPILGGVLAGLLVKSYRDRHPNYYVNQNLNAFAAQELKLAPREQPCSTQLRL